MTRLKRAVVTLAAAGAISVGFAVTPASAGNQFVCPPGSFCFWEDQSFNGSIYNITSSQSNLGGAGDEASSVYMRRSGVYAEMFDDTGYRDRSILIPPGQYYANLEAMNFNDKASSILFR